MRSHLRSWHLRRKPWLHAGLWCRLKLLLAWLQWNNLLRSVHASGTRLTIEDAWVSRNCWLVRISRLCNLILLQLDSVLNSVWITDLAGCCLHRHGLSRRSLVWACLVRNGLHGRSVVC